MALTYLDRVKETSLTSGTGAYALAGAVQGFRAFSAVGNGNTCYYAVTDGNDWEVGLGTYASGSNTLARTSILASSNADAAVSWGSGTKSIWLDHPAAVIAPQTSGVFVPGISFGGGSTGVTYGACSGFVTQTGKVVHVFGILTLTNKGSSTGVAYITGLPFVSKSAGGFRGSGAVAYYANLATISGALLLDIGPSDTRIQLLIGGAALAAQATDVNFTNAATIEFSATYLVD